ncbi:MAG TPA: right-handed parallel beta-helix repeat-containing protein [Kofleriaceae bacterium]|nr:right-handed parallel beta-helix repeat-containing protein [Kofleriaceae bacterium]
MRQRPCGPARTGPARAGWIGLLVVGATGCPTPDPIEACDYATLQDAVDQAPDFARVRICAGVHDQAIVVTRPLEVFGASTGGTVLAGGGAAAIATVIGTRGPVTIRDLTLRPPTGSSATIAGLEIDDSGRIEIDDLVVDFAGAVVPPAPGTPAAGLPVLPGYVGIDVASSDVAIHGVTLDTIGPAASFSTGVRVRGLGAVELDGVHIDGVAGAGIESTDADVTVRDSLVEHTLTGISVLAGDLAVAHTTIDAAQEDGLAITGGYLRADRVTITAPGRHGVLAAGGIADLDTTEIDAGEDGIHVTFGGVTAEACTIADPRAAGLHVHDAGFVIFHAGVVLRAPVGVWLDDVAAYATLRDSDVTGATDRGVLLHDGQLAIAGGTISGSASHGIWADGGSGFIDGTTVIGSGGDGVVATGTAELSATNMNLLDNAGYGLSCDGGTTGTTSHVALLACTGIFDGNGVGAWHLFNGCQALYECIAL